MAAGVPDPDVNWIVADREILTGAMKMVSRIALEIKALSQLGFTCLNQT